MASGRKDTNHVSLVPVDSRRSWWYCYKSSPMRKKPVQFLIIAITDYHPDTPSLLVQVRLYYSGPKNDVTNLLSTSIDAFVIGLAQRILKKKYIITDNSIPVESQYPFLAHILFVISRCIATNNLTRTNRTDFCRPTVATYPSHEPQRSR